MGHIFNYVCVGDVCSMSPRTENKFCRENSCCSMSKTRPGGSQMRSFITSIRSY